MSLSQYPPQAPFDSAHVPTRQSQSELLDAYPIDAYPIEQPPNMTYSQAAPDQGWTQLVLEEMKNLLLLLNAEGRIIYASPSSKLITGRSPKQLEGSLFNEYIHDDDKSVFLRDMDESVASDEQFHTHVRFQKFNGTYCILAINGHPHIGNDDNSKKRKRASQERCVGFFLMCHPCPTKSSLLLDSYLEHKIANARLVQQIAKLKKEEDEEANLARGSFIKTDTDSVDNSTARGSSSDHESTDTVGTNSSDSDTNISSNNTSERGATVNRPSHVDGIEVITGLQYGLGERSEGLSTGRGRLVNCDIDITTAADQARTAQEGDRRKRLRGQYVCTDCTKTDSPEWRKGPEGPKTLCNACGLRHAKNKKKERERQEKELRKKGLQHQES
ncbi:hypothetical protein N7495_003192 [Penicillium taxi]|uniref:uncharacterized protein n=1 Tax=Penicillium taxi TaxID=168475 RepID=UPI0025457562|nr:uncharacterized protein N7495_003192 [Penicillium taxi]KAJ5902664.1 hypothetical protein N7495_003192 [Penicillium taxi]